MNTVWGRLAPTFSRLRPFGLIFAATGVVIYIVRFELVNLFGLDERFVFMAAAVSVVYGAAIFLLNYLSGASSLTYKNIRFDEERMFLKSERARAAAMARQLDRAMAQIDELKAYIEKSSQSGSSVFSEEEKAELKATLHESLLEDASSSVLKALQEKYSAEFQADLRQQGIRNQLAQTRSRLADEIDALNRRGNLNLVIGVLTTSVAVAILASPVLIEQAELTLDTFVSHFLPRLTLSLFIELFSFFFLRLYKAGLSEIKYFQNELTNVEMKFAALDTSLQLPEKSDLAQVLKLFAEADRNQMLDEPAKEANTGSGIDSALLKAAADLVKSIKGS